MSLQAKAAVHNVKLTCNAVQPLVAVNATTVIASVGMCHLLFSIIYCTGILCHCMMLNAVHTDMLLRKIYLELHVQAVIMDKENISYVLKN